MGHLGPEVWDLARIREGGMTRRGWLSATTALAQLEALRVPAKGFLTRISDPRDTICPWTPCEQYLY